MGLGLFWTSRLGGQRVTGNQQDRFVLMLVRAELPAPS